MKKTIGFVLALMLSFSGCRKTPEPTPEPKPQERPKIQSFVPPTAEQAYRLQDDCTRRGEKILADNAVGSALAEEQVSRYNPATNRCYVRLETHAISIKDWDKADFSRNLYDRQTNELLAYVIVKPGGARAYLGFGCGDAPCVEEKIAACMGGKECEPQ
jgi:hypothetical protein